MALVFRYRWVAGRLRLNDEVTDFRWATRDEVTELLDGAYAVRLLDALAYDGKPAVRAHDGVQVLTDIDALTAAGARAHKRRR